MSLEGELRQFDQKRGDKGHFQVQRFVESLVSGNFIEVQKEINLNSTDDAEIDDGKKIVQSNRELFEKELKEV